ncbi:MAG: fumarylacetoacetate hydrolase family protein [Pseudomonadota bacterium]
MKLVRYGRPGKEKPGLIDEEGKLRDLSGVVADIDAGQLSDKALRKLANIEHASLPLVRGNPRYGVPLARVGKLIGVRNNYRDAPAVAGAPVQLGPFPAEPQIFNKAISCLAGPDDALMLPKGSKKTDWEVELGVVIGTRARHVEEADALLHVAGYCVLNDFTERAFQQERGSDLGKGCDGFGPIGPWLVTRDEVFDVQYLDLYLDLNGKRMQTGNTESMIFSVAQLVSYLSRFMTLEPGDVIATGTPPGTGVRRKPQRFLKAGDTLRLGIAGLGEQQQEVLAWQD